MATNYNFYEQNGAKTITATNENGETASLAYLDYKTFIARTNNLNFERIAKYAPITATTANGAKISAYMYEKRNHAENEAGAFFTLADTTAKKSKLGERLQEWRTQRTERANAKIVVYSTIKESVNEWRADLENERANAGAVLDDLARTLERLNAKINAEREHIKRVEKLQAMNDDEARAYLEKLAGEREAGALLKAYHENAKRPLFRDMFKAIASAYYITAGEVRAIFENATANGGAINDKTERAIFDKCIDFAKSAMLITD